MLFFHFVLTNYERGHAHPIAAACLHWLACLACTVVAGVALFVTLAVLVAITN